MMGRALSVRASRQDPVEEVLSELRLEKREGQAFLSRGSCKCKGPEAGADVNHSETSSGARLAD